jgi:hypothetical protein
LEAKTDLYSACPVYFSPSRSCCFEKNLLCAVLERAIKDAAQVFDTRTSNERAAKNNALDWLESDDYSEMSFLWICDNLDLEPLSLRAGINELIKSFNLTGEKHLFSHRKRHGDK